MLIKKTTSVAAIRAEIPDDAELLRRFKVANAEAARWDGERDGLREAVKELVAGKYGPYYLSWTTTAAVCYPNADGKHQLMHTVQTSIPVLNYTGPVALLSPDGTVLGEGHIVANDTLYKNENGRKSAIQEVE